MPAHDNDDDVNDSCVLVGTPLIDLIPEDKKFTNKPKRPEEQIVTDERGRQRFHGAFTGGFSAGYFNSVGTKEGWQPSTFKSSRSERGNQSKQQQRAEDFMDEEDFGDYGIAPRMLAVKSDYKDQTTSAESQATKRNNRMLFFDDLIKPIRSTVGVRMLKKMGWREGQGIGPKIKRRLRQLKAKTTTHEPGRKIYGITLPNETEISDIEDDDDATEHLVSLFDVNQFQFEVKEDQFGLGYKRLNVNQLFTGDLAFTSKISEECNSTVANLLFPELANSENKAKKKRGMTGQAFGVGDFEDDEDVDFYKQDQMENYDFGVDTKSDKEKNELLSKSYGFMPTYYEILKKFKTSSIKQQPQKIFKGPQVPDNFNPKHKFEIKAEEDTMGVYLKTASARGELLDEEFIKPQSVFDLLNEKDRDFLKAQRGQDLEKHKIEQEKQHKQRTTEMQLKEAKEKRYEKFVEFTKKKFKDAYSFVSTTDQLTEWERQHERDEFQKRYDFQVKQSEKLGKNIELKFVSREVLHKTESQNEGEENPKITEVKSEEKIESEMEKAAREKRFGQQTRVEYIWRPHNTLCKRFNVPNPYPDSKECGTVSDRQKGQNKSEKFSLFDHISIQKKFDKDTTDEMGPASVQQKPEARRVNENEAKIEFETKTTSETNKKASFSLDTEEKELRGVAKETINDSNVYLQERPEIDIFKAIFEDDEEPEETETQDLEEKQDEPIVICENEEPKPVRKIVEPVKKSPTPVIHHANVIQQIPSSLSGIDMRKLSRYLNEDDGQNKNVDFLDKNDYDSNKRDTESEYGQSEQAIYKPVFIPKNKQTSTMPAVPTKPASSTITPTIPATVKLGDLIKKVSSSMKQGRRDSSSSSTASDKDNSSDSSVEFIEKTIEKNDKKSIGSKKSSKNKKKNKKHKKSSKKKK